MTRRPPPPETLNQAMEWELTKLRYRALCVCETCAGQATWGHQKGAGGWLVIQPPCAPCAASVAGLLLQTPNPTWRKSLRHPATPEDAPPISTGLSGLKDPAPKRNRRTAVSVGMR
jgi:hypothetical protein